MLTIDSISKYYNGPDGRVTALDAVSLTVADGDFTAVRGPSGCGKSTLLLAAGGLLAPDSGHVVVDNVDPYLLPPDSRARFRASAIGFVFQQFHLVPYLSVLDNILAPSVALPMKSSRDKAMELLERFGLGNRAEHVPAELSTGERQRTALARSLFNDPGLLLADEPTGNLDEKNAATVLECLRGFAESGGAVLMVTHGDQAASFATKTVYLENGALAG